MTSPAGMPSYFWLVSPGLKTPVRDDIPYTTQALRQDLLRVRNAWDECQASRDRNAIYGYLTAVFDLVAWWTAEERALERARKALRLQNIWPSDHDEPFAAIIRCTADPAKVDKRTRSNGRARCGMPRSTRRTRNRLPPSFSGRAGSTSVRRDLPGVSGDAAKVTLNTATELLQPGPVFSALTRFIDLQPRI
jgi:hypothetical protein